MKWMVWVLVAVLACGEDDGDAGFDAGFDAGLDAQSDGALDTPDGGSTLVELRLVGLNDFHGRLEVPTGGGSGGIGNIARIVRELEAEQPNTLVVSAGDMVGASEPLSGLLYDEPTIAAFNLLGLAAAGVGNHEHDRPVAELRRLFEGGCHPEGCLLGDSWEGAEFPLLGANVIDEATDEPALTPYTLIPVAGVSVGFIGVTLENTGNIIAGTNAEGLRFEPEAATVNALLPEVRTAGADIVVVLLHAGGRQLGLPDECINPVGAGFDVVDAFDPGVDIVLSAHTHQAYVCDGVPFVTQSSSYGRLLTVIDMEFDLEERTLVDVRAENLAVRQGDEDPAMVALLDGYRALANPRIDRIIGSISGTIERGSDAAHQSPLGFVVADAFHAATVSEGADFAWTNANGIRDDLDFVRSGVETEDGQVTFGELYAVIPFSNTIVTMTLTGAEIEEVLEVQLASGSTNWPQPSANFRYTWQPGGTPGDQIDPGEILIDGTPIDLGAEYRVTVNSFMADGPSGYESLALGSELSYGPLDTAVVEDYFETNSPIDPPELDRVSTR